VDPDLYPDSDLYPDPDSDGIQIGSEFNGVPRSRFAIRIRIWIQEGKNYPQKLINFIFLSAGCSLLRAEGFS
jgi:hypothetical protein